MTLFTRVRELAALTRLAARTLAGRRYLLMPWLPLLWIGFLVVRVLTGGRPDAYRPYEGQGTIAMPLVMFAILLGIRIVAGEVDKRTLEIAYTVPGGTHRVWLVRFAAAAGLVLLAEAGLAAAVWILLTSYPLSALYGAAQAGLFYLALSMLVAAWFRSEATGALVTVGILFLNGIFTGFGGNQMRISPFWNPHVPRLARRDITDVFAWTVQNRIGFVLLTCAIIALALAVAERRERMLG